MFSYFSKNKHTKRIIPKSATRKQKLLSFKKNYFQKKIMQIIFLLMKRYV